MIATEVDFAEQADLSSTKPRQPRPMEDFPNFLQLLRDNPEAKLHHLEFDESPIENNMCRDMHAVISLDEFDSEGSLRVRSSFLRKAAEGPSSVKERASILYRQSREFAKAIAFHSEHATSCDI